MPAPVGTKTVALALLLTLLVGWLGAGCSSSNQHQSAAGGKPGKHLPLRSGPPELLATVAKTRGPNDPHDFDLSLFIPPGSRLRQLWFIHGGQSADQVLVEWVRSKTISLYGDDFSDAVRWGLILWTQTPPAPANYQAPWRGVAIPLLRLAPGAPNMRVALADVTSDGHPDVLVEQYPHTNHGCGPHEVVSTLRHGHAWRIFRADLCETTLRGSNGLLALDRPYYTDGDSMCCPSKIEKVRLRWEVHRFMTVSDRIVPARRS
jgi:hypothetical protein